MTDAPRSLAGRALSDPHTYQMSLIHTKAWVQLPGVTCDVTSQVVRSRLQQRMARRAIRYRSGWDVLRITLRREGVGGLYKGLLPNVLRVMPQVPPPPPRPAPPHLKSLTATCAELEAAVMVSTGQARIWKGRNKYEWKPLARW